jgi:hypothetical protein
MRSTLTTLLSFYFQQNLRGFLKYLYHLLYGCPLIVSLLKVESKFKIFGTKLACVAYRKISIRLLPDMSL